MKKRVLALLCATIMIIGCLVGCGDTTTSTSTNTKEDVTLEDKNDSNDEDMDVTNETSNEDTNDSVSNEDSSNQTSNTGLHDGMTIDEIMAHAEQNAKLSNPNGPNEDKKLAFKIALDGKELTLPCKLQDLIDMGYQIDIALSKENKTDGYDTYLTNGDKSISVKLTTLEGYYETGEYRNYYYNVALYDTSNETNESITNKWAICDVVGISINNNSNVEVLLDDTISLKSTKEDVVTKYGELDSSWINYYDDNYLFAFNDDNTIKAIRLTLGNINIIEQE